jgi:O-acetyl-ADP-ribose deacetylase (regulator of RNase III)
MLRPGPLRRWEQPEAEYRAWYAAGRAGEFGLGEVQFVQVEPDIWVANMVAQRGVKTGSSGPPIRYKAVALCLGKVGVKAVELGASVHMPRIGCGLAGGEWSRVEPLIEEYLWRRGVAVTVYDFG